MRYGTSSPTLTLVEDIRNVKTSLATFYDTRESTQRVTSLQLPEGVTFHHGNIAPQDFFSHAGNSASLDHSNAYLNVRGGSANSVSLPIQEFADLIGYRNLLHTLVLKELDADVFSRRKSRSGSTPLSTRAL